MTIIEEDNPKLLLVDDDETFCNVLKSALERRSYDVVVANNVKDGNRDEDVYAKGGHCGADRSEGD